MNTKKLALVIAASLSPLLASASDGTLTFAGNLQTETCTITGPKDFTVTLPTVPVSSLVQVWDKAGDTPFSIAISGCTAGVTGANVYFEYGANVLSAHGTLKNNGTATNVELTLYAVASDEQIDLAPPSTFTQYTPLSNNVSSNAARLNFAVAYLAKGTVTPGTVQSSVTYSMVYN